MRLPAAALLAVLAAGQATLPVAARAETTAPVPMRTWILGTDSHGTTGLFYRDGTRGVATLFERAKGGSFASLTAADNGARFAYARLGPAPSTEVRISYGRHWSNTPAKTGTTPFGSALRADSSTLVFAEASTMTTSGHRVVTTYMDTGSGHGHYVDQERPIGWVDINSVLLEDVPVTRRPRLHVRGMLGEELGHFDLPDGARPLALQHGRLVWCIVRATASGSHCANLTVARVDPAGLSEQHELLTDLSASQTITSATLTLDGDTVLFTVLDSGAGDVWAAPRDGSAPATRTRTADLDEREVAVVVRPKGARASTPAPTPAATGEARTTGPAASPLPSRTGAVPAATDGPRATTSALPRGTPQPEQAASDTNETFWWLQAAGAMLVGAAVGAVAVVVRRRWSARAT